jgi:uncharacterized membrane protein
MDGQQVESLGPKVTDQMINSMRSTKTWTRIMSIMGFIGTGFMVLAGICVSIAGSLSSQAKFSPIVGLFYIILSILYIVPSVYLFKYSSALGRFLSNKMASELETALSYQKSFWKFVGIMCLIGIITGIAAAIAIPLMVRH